MEHTILQHQLDQLPEHLKREVFDFIDLLLQHNKSGKKNTPNGKRNGYGCLKGKISMSSDFTMPIDDFREYM